MSQSELILFARAPVPGEAKTRLIPVYTATQAADVAAALIRATVELAAGHWPGPVSLYASPDVTHPVFQELAREFGMRLVKQADGDLGRRMAVALDEGVARSGSAAIMGCDVPLCRWEILDSANELLARGRDVIGPASDGGYYLIGGSRVHPSLFEGMEWGTPGVLAETLARAGRLGIGFELLPELRDIDTADDLRAVARVFVPLRRFL